VKHTRTYKYRTTPARGCYVLYIYICVHFLAGVKFEPKAYHYGVYQQIFLANTAHFTEKRYNNNILFSYQPRYKTKIKFGYQ